MSRILEGEVVSQHLGAIAVEATLTFVMVSCKHIGTELHEVMWHKQYKFVGPVHKTETGYYEAIYQRHF